MIDIIVVNEKGNKRMVQDSKALRSQILKCITKMIDRTIWIIVRVITKRIVAWMVPVWIAFLVIAVWIVHWMIGILIVLGMETFNVLCLMEAEWIII